VLLSVSSFGPVAAFYDDLMENVPYRMWVGYYLLLLAQQDVHPKKLLDVCCGTGTMCEMLHEEGYEVAGFDLSAEMIEVARQKAREKDLPIRYEAMDAAEFEMGEKFDAAYSFFDSLNYITDPIKLRSAIFRVARHVKPGGSFIFDLNTSYAFEKRMFDQKSKKRGSKVQYSWKGEYDPKSLIIQVHMNFWRNGEHVEETHVQRAHPEHEVRSWLALAGFEQVKTYHSYTLDPARPTSDRVHYTAIRSEDD
jgi:SAM-dependent methyltransferase